MPKFGKVSKSRLATCHPLIQELMNEVIKEMDISILCGYRNEKDQNEAYNKGNSKLKYPQSKHNMMPSIAVDCAPYPIDWNDIDRFKDMGKLVQKKAKELGIEIDWGGNWHSFKDYPHFELTVLTKTKKEEYLSDMPTEEQIKQMLEDIEKENDW